MKINGAKILMQKSNFKKYSVIGTHIEYTDDFCAVQ